MNIKKVKQSDKEIIFDPDPNCKICLGRGYVHQIVPQWGEIHVVTHTNRSEL